MSQHKREYTREAGDTGHSERRSFQRQAFDSRSERRPQDQTHSAREGRSGVLADLEWGRDS